MNVTVAGGAGALSGQQQQQAQSQTPVQQQSQSQQQQQRAQVAASHISAYMTAGTPTLSTTTTTTAAGSPARGGVGAGGGVLGVAGGYMGIVGGVKAQSVSFDAVMEQDIQRQMEDFNRTVTIVLWYKAKVEPLRIQQMIRSFPFFQLASLSTIINDLGLKTDSFLDTYIPGSSHWEQHTIHTVRLVETQQRLLYRIRKNLLDGINEEDCVSLPTEIEMQKAGVPPKQASIRTPMPNMTIEGGLPTPITPAIATGLRAAQEKNPLKRPAPEPPDSDPGQGPPAAKVHIPNSFFIGPLQNEAAAAVSSTSTPVLQPTPIVSEAAITTGGGSASAVNHGVTSATTDYLYSNAIYYPHHAPSNSPNVATPQPPSTPHIPQNDTGNGTVAYHPHQPLKRWPNDYSVAEISAGFHEMDRLVSQTPNMTQRVAFERVFGSRYVKSTVCRHRGVWRRALRGVREQFVSMGNDERASWGEFVRAVEGRQPGKMARHAGIITSTPHDAALAYTSAEAGTQGGMMGAPPGPDGIPAQAVAAAHADATGSVVDEPIMDSLQNPSAPAPTTAGGSALQSDLNVFDPGLTHLPSTTQA